MQTGIGGKCRECPIVWERYAKMAEDHGTHTQKDGRNAEIYHGRDAFLSRALLLFA